MLDRSKSLGYLIQPTLRANFFDQYFDQKPLYVPGPEDKFADVFSWDRLNRILNMTHVWSSHNFVLSKDRQVIPAAEYCMSVMGRDGTNILQPRFRDIEQKLKEGSTLTLAAAGQLDPGIASVVASLTTAFSALAECNIYCSWKQVQAFPSHFDVMDVFVLQISGEKVWRLYENRFEAPLKTEGYHFSGLPDDYHDKHKGTVAREVTMTPGDFLYIPKGYYHDALASSDASLHLTFGLTQNRGVDVMDQILASLPDDPMFRAPMPKPDDMEAYQTHLKVLGQRVAEIMSEPALAEQIAARQLVLAHREIPGFNLPDRTYDQTFRLRNCGARLSRKGQDFILTTGRNKIQLDPRAAPVVQWILGGDYFIVRDLVGHFSDHPVKALHGIVAQLVELGVIADVH